MDIKYEKRLEVCIVELYELKAQLVSNQFNSLYVFTGEEVGIMGIYIKKIANKAKLELQRVDSVASVFSKLTNKSFVTTKKCYVIRDDKDYAKQEQLWDKMISGELQGGHTIILVYSKPDKRSKLYKKHKDIMVEFNHLPKEVICKYILKELDLDIKSGTELAQICECDYNRSMLEVDKIKQYASAENITHQKSYDILLVNEVFYTPPGEIIFDFVDAVCKRKTFLAFKLLQELQQLEPSPLGAIALLYNNFQQMLIVKSYKGKNITKSTGLTGWQVGMAKQKLGKYSTSELVNSIKVIKQVERGIKTGWIESNLALDYVLTMIM